MGANLHADDKAKQWTNRIVLVSGPALPSWAMEWLTKAFSKSMGRARVAFDAAIQDADDHSFTDPNY